jgi:RHS repeat-associated protein
MIVTFTRTSLVAIIRYSFVITLLLLPLTTAVSAQDVFDGRTPTGLASGAPAGSYALSGFENVNLFNGNLNFSLPLLKIGGRGSAGYTMMLPIEQTWSATFGSIPLPEGGQINFYSADNTDWYKRIPWFARNRYDMYMPGKLFGRNGVEGAIQCNIPLVTIYARTLPRLTFIMPNGSEIELRDQLTGGEPKPNFCTDSIDHRHPRGRVFISADGTGVTFVSDSDIYDHKFNTATFTVSGILHWPDGARYRIDDSRVTWIEDNNGNRLSFNYSESSFSVTDSMNRQVTVEVNVNDVAPYGLCDRISFKGFGGATRIIRISKNTLGNALRADYRTGGSPSCDATALGIRTGKELFPELEPSFSSFQFDCYNPTVLSAVWLPDDGQPSDRTRYQFYYNRYGELARVELPTGGAIEYDRTPGSGIVNGPFQPQLRYAIYRRIVARRVYSDGATLEGQTVYAESHDNATTTVVVDNLKPNGTLLAREKHYFFGNFVGSLSGTPTSYSPWREGHEYQTEFLGADGATVLRRETVTLQQRAPVNWWTGFNRTPDNAPPNDPRVTEVFTSLLDSNQVSRQAFGYDQYNNRTDVYEYGFGVGASGPLVRHTHTTYLTNNPNQGNVDYAADLNIHIKNLPVDVSVFDGSGAKVSQNSYVYDAYGTQEFPALQDCPNIVQHNPAFHTGYGTRGNLVQIIRVANFSPATFIYNHYQYDIAGNVVRKIDSRGVPVDFYLTDSFGFPDDDARSNAGAPELAGGFSYAFPTKATNALGHTVYVQYDYYLGRAVNFEDANGIISSVAYNDALDRPTQRIQARYRVGVGAPAERRQTTFTYNEMDRVITTTGDLATFNDNVLTTKAYHDGLGRDRRSAAREGSTWTITDKQFDALGRVSQVSNSYRASDPDSATPPAGLWTKTVYDALGRVVDVESPDGTHLITQHHGSQLTAIDQAGKRRRNELDALGRLTRVIEDQGNSNFETFYSYDALGNLRQVTQGMQTRTFVYDPMSRLISATNPESGTVTYVYDPNGNLIEEVDARGVRTTMTYDPLNRVTSKVYTGTTQEGTAAANVTPQVNSFYDEYSALPSGAPAFSGTPSKGRLVGVTYGGGSEGTYYKYDAAGRVVTNHQRQGTANYVTSYTYNLAGDVTVEARGSQVRRRNSMTYDAAGRLSVMQTGHFSGSSFVMSSLVRDISYTPFGALQSETLGNGLIHSMSYNAQLQPIDIMLGRLDNLESVFRINYIFGTASDVNGQDAEITLAHNNGNVARIKYFISGTLQYSQTFQYDPLNRIRYAVEHNNGVYNDEARAWYQTFDYDRFGNCGMNVANTSDNVDAANRALQLADFSAANNRVARAGFVYDSSGNLVVEPGKSYKYDAEGRIVEATVAGMGTSRYFYDGKGQRVRKVVDGVATRFEYGAGGELIAERNETTGAVTKDYFYKSGELFAITKEGGGYEFATSDHLGSPRAWTGPDGSLRRHDYLPFGEELFAGVGIRSSGIGYGGDSARQKFTGKEKDAETGLYNFIARSYSGAQSRFISPDPFNPLIGADHKAIAVYANQPQNWNKYSYALNQPLRYVDPDGKNPLILVGALAGAVAGAAGKYIEMKAQGKEIDWRKVGAAGLGGALTGAVAGATGGASLGMQLATGSFASVVAGGLEREWDGDDTTAGYDPWAMLEDAVGGVFGGVTGAKAVGGPLENMIRVSEPLDIALDAARKRFNASNGSARQAAQQSKEFLGETVPKMFGLGAEQLYGKATEYPSKWLLNEAYNRASRLANEVQRLHQQQQQKQQQSRPGLDINKCGPIDNCVIIKPLQLPVSMSIP